MLVRADEPAVEASRVVNRKRERGDSASSGSMSAFHTLWPRLGTELVLFLLPRALIIRPVTIIADFRFSIGQVAIQTVPIVAGTRTSVDLLPGPASRRRTSWTSSLRHRFLLDFSSHYARPKMVTMPPRFEWPSKFVN
jgi:hypothetical protein